MSSVRSPSNWPRHEGAGRFVSGGGAVGAGESSSAAPVPAAAFEAVNLCSKVRTSECRARIRPSTRSCWPAMRRVSCNSQERGESAPPAPPTIGGRKSSCKDEPICDDTSSCTGDRALQAKPQESSARGPAVGTAGSRCVPSGILAEPGIGCAPWPSASSQAASMGRDPTEALALPGMHAEPRLDQPLAEPSMVPTVALALPTKSRRPQPREAGCGVMAERG